MDHHDEIRREIGQAVLDATGLYVGALSPDPQSAAEDALAAYRRAYDGDGEPSPSHSYTLAEVRREATAAVDGIRDIRQEARAALALIDDLLSSPARGLKARLERMRRGLAGSLALTDRVAGRESSKILAFRAMLGGE